MIGRRLEALLDGAFGAAMLVTWIAPTLLGAGVLQGGGRHHRCLGLLGALQPGLAASGAHRGEVWVRRKDGAPFPAWQTVTRIPARAIWAANAPASGTPAVSTEASRSSPA